MVSGYQQAVAAGATFDAWAADLRGHRAAYGESSFRWDQSDVLTLISWATGARLEFSTVDDLSILRRASLRLRAEMRAARADIVPSIARATSASSTADVVQALGMPQTTIEQLASARVPDDHRPSTLVHRATRGLHDNPLVHAWEAHQAWTMIAAAFEVVDDTITTVVWELHHDAGYALPELATAAAMTENQILARIHRRERESAPTAAPNTDPRRPTPIPRQTYRVCAPAAGPARWPLKIR